MNFGNKNVKKIEKIFCHRFFKINIIPDASL